MTTCTCTVACSYACEELGIQYKRTVVGCAKRTRPRIAWHGARGYSIHRVPGMHVPCPDQPLDRPACVYCNVHVHLSFHQYISCACRKLQSTITLDFVLLRSSSCFPNISTGILIIVSVLISVLGQQAQAAMSPLLYTMTRLCHPCRLSVLAAS
jgi:hypothetical protein